MGRTNLRQFSTLSIDAGPEGVPPTEFRIFAAGANPTENGYTVLFDAEAAAAVMAAYERHGVDRMIDLEHLSLDQDAPHYDPDARGWAHLEVRRDATGAPELWAVHVRWTPDGESRLREKRQRYISPAFTRDPKTNRVTEVLNIAIVAMPATRQAQPLVAASLDTNASTPSGATVDPKQLQAAIEAIKNGDGEGALAVLEAMLVASAAGDAGAEEPADGPAADPAMAAQQAETVAAAASLLRLTAKATHIEALGEVESWRKSHLELEAGRAKLAEERAVLELGQRKANAVQLVKLGAETPHTSGLAVGKLVDRLMVEPLAEQTARVQSLLAARGGKVAELPRAPAGPGAHGLSERELKICAESKCDPATFAMLKARRTGTG